MKTFIWIYCCYFFQILADSQCYIPEHHLSLIAFKKFVTFASIFVISFTVGIAAGLGKDIVILGRYLIVNYIFYGSTSYESITTCLSILFGIILISFVGLHAYLLLSKYIYLYMSVAVLSADVILYLLQPPKLHNSSYQLSSIPGTLRYKSIFMMSTVVSDLLALPFISFVVICSLFTILCYGGLFGMGFPIGLFIFFILATMLFVCLNVFITFAAMVHSKSKEHISQLLKTVKYDKKGILCVKSLKPCCIRCGPLNYVDKGMVVSVNENVLNYTISLVLTLKETMSY